RVTGEADLAGTVASVPPDLVARVSGTALEVAHGEVLDTDVVRLPHDDAVAPLGLAADHRAEVLVWRGGATRDGRTRLGAIDDDGVAVQAPDVEIRCGHDDAAVVAGRQLRGRGHVGVVDLVVITRGDEDPVAR